MTYHSDSGWRKVLSLPSPFNWIMRAVGYHNSMSTFARDHVRASAGSKILDIGCGTSLILEYLPEGVTYRGYDMNPRYIEDSKAKHASSGGRFEFRAGDVQAMSAAELEGRFDIVLAISLLHHLSDEEARRLFDIGHSALSVNGRMITFDPVNVREQHPVGKLMNRFDRGANIRTPEAYRSLVPRGFAVSQVLRQNMGSRIPGTAHILECIKSA